MTQIQLREKVLQDLLLYVDNTEEAHQAACHIADEIFPLIEPKKYNKFERFLRKLHLL